MSCEWIQSIANPDILCSLVWQNIAQRADLPHCKYKFYTFMESANDFHVPGLNFSPVPEYHEKSMSLLQIKFNGFILVMGARLKRGERKCKALAAFSQGCKWFNCWSPSLRSNMYPNVYLKDWRADESGPIVGKKPRSDKIQTPFVTGTHISAICYNCWREHLITLMARQCESPLEELYLKLMLYRHRI